MCCVSIQRKPGMINNIKMNRARHAACKRKPLNFQ